MKISHYIALISLLACGNFVKAQSITFDTTTTTGWTATGGGAQNVAPYVVLFTDSNGPSHYLSVTNTGGSSGTFLPGGSEASFTGFWTATYTFTLPQTATNVSLNYGNFWADDRGVLYLNGNILNATGIYAGGAGGSMVFTDGGTPQSYSGFSSPNGQVGGTASSGFNIGGVNTIEVIMNNTGDGIYGSDASGSNTFLRISGTVSYSTIPEPSTWVMLTMGGAGLLIFAMRRRAGLLRSVSK